MIEPINLSPSFLSVVFDKGFDYAVAQKLGMIDKLPTQAMDNGRLIHAMIAEALGNEPAKYAVSPYDSYRTKEAREWRDSQPDDTLIVSQDTIDTYSGIVNRILAHPRIKPLLQGNVETEKIYIKEENGFTVKGILDLVVTGESTIIVDWKFVSSQIFDDFGRKSLYSNYDLQAAVYDYLSNAANIYFCAIENEMPYRIKLFHCDSSYLESGADKFDKAVKIVKEAKWRSPNFDIDDVPELMSWNNFNG